jgi:hypothetical protein
MKVVALPALLTFAALVLVALNFDTPRMRAANWAETVPYGNSDRYFAAYDQYRTQESKYFDVGVGLASFGVSILALILITGAKSFSNIRKMQTPRHRSTIVRASNFVWAYWVIASGMTLMLQFYRQEFPPWADSLGIPFGGLVVSGIVGGLLMNIGLAIYLHGSRLPVSMWVLPKSLRGWLLNAGVLVALVICVSEAVYTIRIGDPFTPPAIVGVISLLLVGRAAASNGPQRDISDSKG